VKDKITHSVVAEKNDQYQFGIYIVRVLYWIKCPNFSGFCESKGGDWVWTARSINLSGIINLYIYFTIEYSRGSGVDLRRGLTPPTPRSYTIEVKIYYIFLFCVVYRPLLAYQFYSSSDLNPYLVSSYTKISDPVEILTHQLGHHFGKVSFDSHRNTVYTGADPCRSRGAGAL
jgi:hypothetical protein